jgi:hypothetical protein
MKSMMLAASVAVTVTVTAGIASAGIASLANGAAVLINASSRSVSPCSEGTVQILGGRTKLVSHRDPDHPPFPVFHPLRHRD